MRPIIGISPDFHAGDEGHSLGGGSPTYYVQERYTKALEHAGAIPIILSYAHMNTLRPLLTKQLHGLMMIGSGSDLDPRWYGEPPICSYPIMSTARSEFDIALAKTAWKTSLPLLGICGGMQTVNVALGGTLVQDIATQLPRASNHKPDGPVARTAHSISIAPKSRLARIVGRRQFRVNSCHHQALKTVAPQLTVSATAPDGIIEAIEAPMRTFFVGIQWHPEHLYARSEPNQRLFSAFVRASRRHASATH
ncbi:MAG TPA: gamma-glutamyl-gamma-aminobutyrate hydrolase family protein [Nitrospirales bacterium]|jgi:putative glutamine amidotransferase|nr:gamma-glutamyl-gamma-aminobutyrate hydrolase family protein [Nitrospirales bacterium]HIA13954.1 gamma-glutamyl-gamma-aminobutyrate hydrolase family protein [Nitrospirales bacterium]HIB54469.1 gamma-glutamyl-gamma-aminobutyrate hydrolase family protein [Nitrospirales bacterium]HIC03913.1 gamma-glutamyl-gamma-aminobutyrate hydrolase family protein [Nitrospirales bacterium]HIN32818.1 gamma-glutamyl-gamma-aminobutyrate hydrolase family protein [Nitrospirales bacterium]